MGAKAILLAGLFVFGMFAPGVVGSSSAGPIPNYFRGLRSSLICIVADVPDLGTIFALLTVNYDPSLNGGISLAQADALHAQLVEGGGFVASLVGLDFAVLCDYSPSAIRSLGFDGFTLVAAISSIFASAGFDMYVALDEYRFFAPSFLGGVRTVRVDAFDVVGPNNLQYMGSAEIPEDFVF